MTPQPDPTRRAVRQYWRTLTSQADRESATRSGDRGRQAAVGGKQMGGFASLIADTAVQAGLPQDDIYFGQPLSEVLPGYYRATKRWDVVAVHRERLIFAIELKSQTGPSYGNNLNNRIEEAIGSSVDFWTAYREGAFGRAPRPFLGYVYAFEESPAALRPVRIDKPHFAPMPVFEGTSYADRARILCERLVLERNYDSAWFLLMDRKGTYREPSEMLTGAGFLATIGAHVTASLATP